MTKSAKFFVIVALSCFFAHADDIEQQLNSISQALVDVENTLRASQEKHETTTAAQLEAMTKTLGSMSTQLSQLRNSGSELNLEKRLHIAELHLDVAQAELRLERRYGARPTAAASYVCGDHKLYINLAGEMATPPLGKQTATDSDCREQAARLAQLASRISEVTQIAVCGRYQYNTYLSLVVLYPSGKKEDLVSIRQGTLSECILQANAINGFEKEAR